MKYKTYPITLSILNIIMFFSLTGNKITGQVSVELQFLHYINAKPAIYDSLCYVNPAGNKYMINQVQYFISEISFHKKDGDNIKISTKKPIHYIDKDIPKTIIWNITEDVQTGEYDSISFIFGISDGLNKSYMYKNPPENLMFWPDILGGGYHFMKINLKYIDKNGELSNFNCHLGKGQIYDANQEVVSFIDNSFKLSFPATLVINENKPVKIALTMNIEKWFDKPNLMDLNNYHGIMDNQAAMHKFCQNAINVFNIQVSD
jgi:hypothetical protein